MGNKPAPGASINLIQSIPPVFTHVGIIMGARAALPTLVLNAEKASIQILKLVWLVQLQVVLIVLHNLVARGVFLAITSPTIIYVVVVIMTIV